MKNLNLIMLKLALGLLILSGLAIQAAQERPTQRFHQLAVQIDAQLEELGADAVLPESVRAVLRRFNKNRGAVTTQRSVTQTDITAAENALKALQDTPRPLPVPQMRRNEEQEEEIKDIESEIVRAPDPQRVEQLLPGLPFHMREAPDDPELQRALAASRESAAQEERKLRGFGGRQEQTDDEEDKKEMAIVPYRPRMAPEREQVMREVVGGIKGVSTLTGHQLNTELMTLMSEYAASSWLDKNAEIKPIPVKHSTPAAIRSIAISPDSQNIAVMSNDTARIWNKAGELVHILANAKTLSSLAISPNGQFIVLSDYNKPTKIFSPTGDLLKVFEEEEAEGARSVAISPNSQFIVIGYNDATVAIYSPTGELLHTLLGHTAPITSIRISPDNKFIVTGSGDHTARIWNSAGQSLHVLPSITNENTGYENDIEAIAISPDNQFFVMGYSDGSVRIWNFAGELLHTLEEIIGFPALASQVSSISIDPTSQFIVTSSYSSNDPVQIWNRSGKLLHAFHGHRTGATAVVIDPRGEFIVTGHENSIVKIWNFDAELIRILRTTGRVVSKIAISPDNQFIVAGSDNGQITIWRLVD